MTTCFSFPFDNFKGLANEANDFYFIFGRRAQKLLSPDARCLCRNSFAAFCPWSFADNNDLATSDGATSPVEMLSKESFSVFSESNSQRLIIFSVIVVIKESTSSLSFCVLSGLSSLCWSVTSETPDISLKLVETKDLRCLVSRS